ncbi:MAG: hypothetical protein DWQ36_22050 [Acidobacteria bacterium]|nr:MAG: hypothetical protein DWQ30_00490 [Acidobacteriota bacterium]REK00872.1 MAG: hypothetical protein DWQ36_22050 [Acidobacteriota bacterium]
MRVSAETQTSPCHDSSGSPPPASTCLAFRRTLELGGQALEEYCAEAEETLRRGRIPRLIALGVIFSIPLLFVLVLVLEWLAR